LKNTGITENEKKFRAHLKKFYPDKYNILIAMDQAELEDNVLKVSPT